MLIDETMELTLKVFLCVLVLFAVATVTGDLRALSKCPSLKLLNPLRLL